MRKLTDEDKEDFESQDTFGPLNRLTKTLNDHDDRGLILSLAAFAEDALGRLLEKFMLPVQTSKDLLTGFNAPLGTFSSRIKASYSLGLIDDEQFKDLEYLRKMRNEFAHSWEHVSLAQQNLASIASNMSFSYLDNKFPKNEAEKVRSSVTALLVDISSMTQQIEAKEKRIKLIGTRLIPLFPGEPPEQVKNARESLQSIKSEIASHPEIKGDLKRFIERRKHLLNMQLTLLANLVPRELKPEVMSIILEAGDLN